MTGVYSFGSHIIKPLRRTLTLRTSNIFPLLITDKLNRKRKALRNLQEVQVKSYFWCPDILTGLESIS